MSDEEKRLAMRVFRMNEEIASQPERKKERHWKYIEELTGSMDQGQRVSDEAALRIRILLERCFKMGAVPPKAK